MSRRPRTREEILRDGFPADLHALTPFELSLEAAAERQFAGLAHGAVHSGDEDKRNVMRSLALQWLLSEDPLPPTLREWLYFVLYSLDPLPTAHKGRPFNGMLNRSFLWELGRFAVEYRREHPGASTTKLRMAAAKKFNKSARTLEKHMGERWFTDSVAAHQKFPRSSSPRK